MVSPCRMRRFTTFAFPPAKHVILVFACILVTAAIELAMGRVPISKEGYVALWYGNTNGPGNSQHITDWYSLSHLIHGMLFYGILWLLVRRKPVSTRFMIAIALECAWEIWENTPFIIERYRSATLAHDYYGDSVLNSISDIVCAGIGFIIARKAPLWVTVALIIFMEVLAAAVVRDNLTLNVLMLIFPIEAVKQWQMNA